MKYYIRRRVKPTKKEEITQGIREFWSIVSTPVMCTRYTNRMLKDAELIVANDGAALRGTSHVGDNDVLSAERSDGLHCTRCSY